MDFETFCALQRMRIQQLECSGGRRGWRVGLYSSGGRIGGGSMSLMLSVDYATIRYRQWLDDRGLLVKPGVKHADTTRHRV